MYTYIHIYIYVYTEYTLHSTLTTDAVDRLIVIDVLGTPDIDTSSIHLQLLQSWRTEKIIL